jgi:hypothetical protein
VIYVSADLDGWGIEVKSPGDGLVMTHPDELELSPRLCLDLRYWQQ